jgi:dihydrofolate reductase
MSVTVYIATTLNGQINADVPHDSWISEASWETYLQTLRSLDVAIVGGKTYAVMDDEEFPEKLKFIVLTHHATELPQRQNVSFSKDTPSVVIDQLKAQQKEHIGILGGAEIISEYVAAGLVDEIVIDLQPVLNQPNKNVVIAGLPMQQLQLIAVTKLDANVVQLRYRVC